MTTRPPSPKARVPLGGANLFALTAKTLDGAGLNSVCREARCPNRAECWDAGVATVMLLGAECTRGCGFCAVTRSTNPSPPDPEEPARVALAAAELNLLHLVLTSVTRDDLPDGGAAHFAQTTALLKASPTGPRVETLTPDYRGEALEILLENPPDVFAHNLETVARLTPEVRHPRFAYEGSLATLAEAKALRPSLLTKSSLLLGLGEEKEEVLGAFADLREAGVDLLALGQYLRPTAGQAPVVREVSQGEFDELREAALEMGFAFVAAGPLVRTSYRAFEAWSAVAKR